MPQADWRLRRNHRELVMPNDVEAVALTEILFIVQGHAEPRAHSAHPTMTVAEIAEIVARADGIEETVEVFIEDAEEPLAGELILIEHLSVEFSPLHVARHRARIAVTIEYNLQQVEREFRPNATIERITRWAIGPEGLKLEGAPSDYQLKHDGVVLPPDMHLGQIPHPHHKVKLDLVFKIKPQGAPCVG
jgi:hypothetical protein